MPSADAKSAVLCILLSVPSLRKVEVSNFSLLHFPRWFFLIHRQPGMSLRRLKRLVIFKCLSLRYSTMVSFVLSATFSLTEIHPKRDSVKSQLLCLYSQFSFTKILKALHKGFDIYKILEECPKALLKMFLTDFDRLKLPRCSQDVIFEHIF